MMNERKQNRLDGYDYSRDNLYFVTICVKDKICYFGTVSDTPIVRTGRDLSLLQVPHSDPSQYHIVQPILPPNELTQKDLYQQSLTNPGEFKPQIILNEIGKIAEKQWHWLAEKYPYVVLHAFVVMPNHVHGIIEICRSKLIDPHDGNYAITGTDRQCPGRDRSRPVPTPENTSRPATNCPVNSNQLQHRQQQPESQPTKIKSLSGLIGAYKTTVSKQIHLAGLVDFSWQRSFHDHIIRNKESLNRIETYIINNPQNWKEDKLFN